MESWSYASEGRGLLFSEEEVDLTMDALARNREVLMGWDITSPCDSENSVLVSDREAVETMEFMELGLLDMMIKPLPSNPSKIHLGGEIGDDLCQSVVSPACMIASSSFLVEEESGSRVSNSLMESNSSDSSLIDLKLGRLPDCGDAKNGKLLSEKSRPAKRARATNLYLQTPYCQVHGCNKDLSSSKDYHKRHKVCDLHSKTAKVVVNGIEQRFCQQCSRFHLLGEFDDGKRSCRRRLAGHNERRRKIQFDSYPSRHQNLLQSYQGARFQATSSPTRKASVWSEVFPGGVLYTDRYELANSCKRMKSEREPTYNSQLATPITSHLFRESILPLHCVGRERLSGIYQSGSEDYSPFNAASNIHELSHLSNSGCALSLLSAHSQDLSSHWAGILLASPMTTQGSHCNYSAGQNPNKSLGISSLGNFIPCGSHSSGMNLIEVGQTEPVMLSDVSDAAEFGVHSDGNLGNFQRSDSLSTKNCLPHERECTVDLLQLSSHLQRVEQQRNYMQVKQENQGFCYFPNI